MARRYKVIRTMSLEVELTAEDLADQEAAGDTDRDSVLIIAESTPHNRWEIDDEEVEAMR